MLTQSPNLRCAQSQDGAVVLDLAGGRLFSLNPVAARIFVLIGERFDEPAIIETLRSETGCGEANVEADIREFLQSLRKNGLIGGEDTTG